MISHEQSRIPDGPCGSGFYLSALLVYTNSRFFTTVVSFTELLLIIWAELFERHQQQGAGVLLRSRVSIISLFS